MASKERDLPPPKTHWFKKFLWLVFLVIFGFLAVYGGYLKVRLFFISNQRVTLISQQVYATQGTGGARLFVEDEKLGGLVSKAKVKVDLLDSSEKKLTQLFEGETDETGNVGITFDLKDLKEGEYFFEARVKSEFGKDTVKKSFFIKNKPRITLTTDRSLYKPGQTLKWRALLTNEHDLKPIENLPVSVSIYDGDKNLVFKNIFPTSKYGMIGDEFPLANELNTGDFKLAIKFGDYLEEKLITVKPFQLPKFSVNIETDKKYYKPNELLKGKVKVNYFFGEPVENGKVETEAFSEKFSGATNKKGEYEFSFKAKEQITLAVKVIDESNNLVESEKKIVVDPDIIKVTFSADGEKIKPGLNHEIYVLATYPDGTPAKVSLRVSESKNIDLATNEFGIGWFNYRYESNRLNTQTNIRPNMPIGRPYYQKERSDLISFKVSGEDDLGNKINTSISVPVDLYAQGHLLIRPEKSVLDEPTNLKVFVQSNQSTGAVYLDVVQNGTFMATYGTNLANGQGEIILPLNENNFGTLELLGYQRIETRGRYLGGIDLYAQYAKSFLTIRDSKIIFVNGKKGLLVAANLDKSAYRPGAEAKVSLTVTNEDGGKENAALGIKVIDEAMLALEGSESAAFSKIYFLLDRRLQDATYQLNGITLTDSFNREELSQSKNVIAKAILAKASMLITNFVSADTEHADLKNKFMAKVAVVVNILTILIFLILAKLLFKSLNYSIKLVNELKGKTALAKVFGLSLGIYIPLLFIATVLKFETNELFFRRGYLGATLRTIEKLYEKSFELFDAFSLSYNYYILIGILFLGVCLAFIKVKKSSIEAKRAVILSGCALILLAIINILFPKDGSETLATILTYAANIGTPLVLIFSTAFLASAIDFRVGYWIYASFMTVSYFFMPGSAFILLIFSAFIDIFYHAKAKIEDFEMLSADIMKKLNVKKGPISHLESYFLYEKINKLKKKGELLKAGKVLLISGFLGVVISGIGYVIVNTVLNSASGGYLEYDDFATDRSNRSQWPGSRIQESVRSPGIGPKTLFLEDFGAGDSSDSMPSFLPYKGLFSATKQLAQESEGSTPFDLGLPIKESKATEAATQVRKFFPEVMYFNPALIAENGTAELVLQIADSITTWRLSALASSLSGKIGSTDTSLKVFQEFFIDFELPTTLIVGDEIEFPVTLFNYSNQELELGLITEIKGIQRLKDLPFKEKIAPNSKISRPIRIKAIYPGEAIVRLEAIGDKVSDAIEKTVRINPDGKVVKTLVTSDKLPQTTEAQVNFPKNTISGTESILLKIAPSYFSQVIEGLEAILRFPSGCFEQISSSLYPDILVLDYLRRTNQATPDTEKKALDHIKTGLQKILTYEVREEMGGFSLYGNSPAETVLTAYGFMEFNDLKKVYTMDTDLLNRMKQFLTRKLNRDGSFQLSGGHQGGLSSSDDLAKNAYIIWALSHTDAKDSLLKEAINYLKQNISKIYEDSYVLALSVNALINSVPQDPITKSALEELRNQAQKEGEMIFFTMKNRNYYGSYGISGNIEATALAAMAFMKDPTYQQFGTKALNYVLAKKDPQGSWHSTQATILALKALLTATEMAEASAKEGEITASLNEDDNNGKDLVSALFALNKENNLVTQMASWNEGIKKENVIKLSQTGGLNATYDLIKTYAVPWEEEKNEESDGSKEKGLDVEMVYQIPSALKVNDTYKVNVSVKDFSLEAKNNVMLKLPIPAGHVPVDPIKEISTGNQFASQFVKKVEVYEDSILVYMTLPKSFQSTSTLLITYTLRPQYPAKVKIPPALIYDYYNPFDEDYSKAGSVEVK